ncbi:MAG TPA: BTAD domain-containing putative transcriptional regulator [Acidimicrobiales bacterium]
MGVAVLGPLRVDGDGLLRPRDRAALAALVVRRGQVVAPDQLADALWGEQPPQSWAKQVQICVGRLRKVLGPATIDTTPGGYRLSLPSDDVDVDRFERLVERGRELAATGEPDRAASAFTRALSLWHGRPFEDIDGWLPGRTEAARLDEIRRTAEEDLLNARLVAGEHREVAAEAETLVAEEPMRERRWAILALAQYRCGRQAEALRTLHRARSALVEQLGLEPGDELVALEAAILRHDSALDAARTSVVVADVCPYKGLASYDVGDNESFFGRDTEVAACLERLSSAALVVVAGPSGCGKSSLVRAGLVPALQKRGRSAVVFVPGADPDAALTKAMTAADGRPILVVDQFEELFTLGTSIDVIRSFEERLYQYATDCAPVVIAVRSDHLAGLIADTAFGRLAEQGLHLVSPLAGDALREAIERPAALAGLRLEHGLVDLLARDVDGEPGALPLLSHALAETWRRRDGPVLTVEGYQATGGIRGAVARSADRLYDSLSPDQRSTLRSVMMRLVGPSLDGDPVRRRVASRTLRGDPARERVVALLVQARLVTAEADSVELAHEALARAWPRLQSWLDDDAAGQRILRHLASAADGWDSLDRSMNELYRGARLDTALEWREATRPDLTDVERAFLEASLEHATTESQALVERARRDAHQKRRLRLLLLGTAIALAVALAAGTVAVVQGRSARDSSRRAEASSFGAETGRLLATARSLDTVNTPVAALLALEASRRRGVDPVDADASLQQILTAKPGFLGSFPTVGEYTFGFDGTSFVSRTGKGVEVYDLTDRARRASVDHPSVRGMSGRRIATSQDGLLVETAGDREVHRYRLPMLEAAGDPIVTPGSINAVAMSASGTLVTAHPGGLVVVWDAAAGREQQRFHVGSDVQRLDVSAGGSRVAVLTATSVQVWDAASGEPVGPEFSSGGSDVALAPDGRSVVVVGIGIPGTVFDGVTGAPTTTLQSQGNLFARFIDDERVAVSSGAAVTVLDASTGAVLVTTATTCGCDIALSPDGHTVATGLDGPGLYALDGRELLADALDAPGLANAAGFSVASVSGDGRRLSVSAYGAGTTLFERDAQEWRSLATTAGVLGTMQPDGRLLQVDPAAGTGSLVDPATGAVQQTFPGPGDADFPVLVDLSRDGRLEAYGGLDGAVTVVDTSAATVVAHLSDLQDLNAGNDYPFASFVAGAYFSTDDRWLVAAAWSGAAVAWDTSTWRRVAVLEPPIADVNGSATPAFDPTGRYVAVSRGRTSIDIFDATTLQPVRSIPIGVQGLPYRATFDPSGERLVVVMDTAGAITYDVETGRRLGAPLVADLTTGVEFVDATTLAIVAPARQLLLLWHLDHGRLEAEACLAAGRNLTRDEWARLGPAGESYRLSCPQYGEPPDDPTLSVEQPPVPIDMPTT